MNTPHALRSPHSASRLPFYVSRFAPLATLLLAFFLRVYRLADKNIWWDEGWSIWLAKQDFVAIALRTAMDEHPPLHYWMLKVWIALFGSSAYSGRFLSVAFGVLTVALLCRIGKRVSGSWVGVLAAFILAISRFHIWWSQDIKNYTPSIFFAFAAVWFGLNVLSAERRVTRTARDSGLVTQHSIFYALCAALAMFTHYLAALVLLALNAYALIAILSRAKILSSANSETLRSAQGDKLNSPPPLPRAPLLTWLLANALAAALFAPWLYLYLQNAQSWVAAPAFDFTQFLKLVATVLPLGVTTDIDDYLALTIVFTIIAALSSVWIFKKQNDQPRVTHYVLLFILIIALPPLLIYVLSLTPAAFFAPKIQARYLVVLAPAYAMLIALGILFLSRLSRNFAALVFLALCASSVLVLRDYYAERRLLDEYATLAGTINAFARQGDLVLLDTDQEWPTFLYYLRAPIDWMGVPNGKTMDDANADSIIKRALNRNSAVWLVTIPDALATDPQKILETQLAGKWRKQFEKTFSDKRLVLYAPDLRDLMNVAPENFAPQTKMSSDAFLGFDLPIREAYAGDTVRVVTYWNVRAEKQVEMAIGNVSATERVVPGERVRVESALVLPLNAAGELPLTVNQIEIARIRVEPRATLGSVDKIARRTDYRFDDSIHLLGYNLPITNFRSGDSIPVTLFWRAEQPTLISYVVFVHLLGSELNSAQNNFLWGQIDRVPRDGAYPTTAWQPNQVVSDPYRVPIAPNASPGKYKIEVGMYDVITGMRMKLSDGSDAIILAEVEIR